MNSTRLRELRELAERIRINQREKRRENLEKVNLRRAAAEIRRRRAADASQNAYYPDASDSYNEPTSYDKPVHYDEPVSYKPVNYDEPVNYKPVNYDEPVNYDKSVNYDEPVSYKPVNYKPVSYKPYDINGPRDIEEERRRFNKLMGRQDPLAEIAYWQQEESDDSEGPEYHVPPIQNKAFRHALPTPHSIKWWNAYRDPDWDPETAHVVPQEQIRPLSPQPETPLKTDFDWKLTNNPDSILASTPLVTKHGIEEPQTPEQSPEQSPVSEESQNLPLTPTLSPIEIAPPAEGKDPNADPPDEARDLLRALSRKLAKTSSPIIYDEDWDPVNHCPKKATKHGPSTDDKHGPSTDDKHGPSTDDVPNQPTNSGRAEEAREQEALQLRSMNSRLHAASRSIRDAYRNARQLVDSVDTAELMGHKCKVCETCGHVEQHPIVMICTGIKRLLISSENSHGRTNLTWFGLIFMILSLWYMTEIAISEFFGTTDYASTMHGYGVFPDSPRYPFALLTLISWIPPFSWLTPLFKANMFYEATKTVQGF